MSSKSMTVTITAAAELVLPPRIWRKAGIKAGDQLEVKASGGIVTVIPKLPVAADEYTSGQRRAINARLDEAEADIKAGRLHGPFDTHAAMIKFLHSRRKARQKKNNQRKTR